MPVAIPLEFIPPDQEGIVALRILEAADPTGQFAEIERVTNIGVFPDYIDRYTTELANDAADWFSIQWEDAEGALSAQSPPVKGGTRTLVQEVVDRIMQRDSSIPIGLAAQEGEGAVEWYFNDNPYKYTAADIDSTKTYRVLNGLTYLALARSYIVQAAIHDKVEQGTIGVLSFRTQAGVRSGVDVKQLVDLANELLELNISTILQLCEVYRPRDQWDQLYEDWQVEWQQIPWIKGLYVWGSTPTLP